MKKKEIEKKYKSYIESFKKYNLYYFSKSNPLVSDGDYDKLKRDILDLEKEHKYLKSNDSPSILIGHRPSKNFKKFPHRVPMLSLGNAFSEEDLINFEKKITNFLSSKEDFEISYCAEPKIDGISASLTYINGIFEKGLSRGDGKEGEDITRNLKTIKDIPKKILSKSFPKEIDIRGEVFIQNSDFENLKEKFANPRNAASGSLRQKNPEDTKKIPLKFIAYTFGFEKGLKAKNQFDYLQKLSKWGFKTNRLNKLISGVKNLIQNYNEIEKKRANLDFDIDGIVYKVNDFNLQKRLGNVANAPRWAIAHKFSSNKATSEINDIEIQVGRTGALTPVAKIKPINIGGVLVSNATLHNEDEIIRKDIRIDDTVTVERAGDVIPHVVSVDVSKRKNTSKKFIFPKKCPCGYDTIKEFNKVTKKFDAIRRCPDRGFECNRIAKEKLKHFVSKEAFNIDGLGKKIIENFWKLDLIKLPQDIFKLDYEKIQKLDGWGKLSADNLKYSIDEKKQISFERFIYSLGIRHIGKLFDKGKFTEIHDLYNKIKFKFGDRFYIEIQRHKDLNETGFEKFNLKKSSDLEIPIIATNEVYYLNKDMHEAHDALICIGNKTYVNEKNRLKLSDQHYFKNNSEMSELFADLPEALENNYNFPLRCNFRPLFSNPILPNISQDKGGDADEILKKESLEGLKTKFEKVFNISVNEIEAKKNYLDYKKRLDHELSIIIEMKYASYFLIVSDYIKWAKNNDIPVGPGRGSGAGSLVAWCLSITDVDPIKFNLIFERFLNPDRISMPDFDIDFCEDKRDLVFEYLTKKYKDSVAHIITFGKLKARMVIRDVGRVLGLSYGFVDSISKMIPFDPSRPQNLTQCIAGEPRLQKLINEDPKVKKLTDLSLQLEGLNRNVATHAAGVVIADRKLTEVVPLYKDSSANLLLPSTQFDMYSAENAGLIKFDFLGLKTLTVISNTQKLIKKINKDFDIEKIDFEDQNVFDLLSSGKTVGLFQIESAGMREALIQMKPNHIEDIIALVALYRPGPMSNIPTYNDCKHGRQKPDYLHPLLEDILKPTYGVIIYQEQVMQIAQKLSGFSAGQADLLRRAMGKKKRAELEKQKQGFIDGAIKNGIAKDVAAGIFLKIEPFAEYGFNKSHAAAYAIISYQTAFLKTYYPQEFIAASMTMDISNQNKLSEFYEELNRLNVEVVRPDINECFANFRTVDGKFYYALGGIKAVGYEAISNIIEERIANGKFSSINDFLNRVNPKDINKLQLEGLVKAGAFDNINPNRRALLDSIPNIITKSKNIFENKSANQIDLFSEEENIQDDIINNIEDWQFEERLAKEFEAVGFFISDHPLNQFTEIFNDYKINEYTKFILDNEIKNSNIAATLLKLQEKKTAKGNSYAVLKLTDLSSVFELFIFSDVLELNREILKEGNSLILNLVKNVTEDENRFKRINVQKISSLKELFNSPINEVCFEVSSKDQVQAISKILKENGKTLVNINLVNDGDILQFKLKNSKNLDRKSLNLLRKQQIQATIS